MAGRFTMPTTRVQSVPTYRFPCTSYVGTLSNSNKGCFVRIVVQTCLFDCLLMFIVNLLVTCTSLSLHIYRCYRDIHPLG